MDALDAERALKEHRGMVARVALTAARHFNISNRSGFCGQLELDDLIQAGNLGLLKALRRYDPGRGHKFLTYAIWWVRKEIRLFVLDCLMIKNARFAHKVMVPLGDAFCGEVGHLVKAQSFPNPAHLMADAEEAREKLETLQAALMMLPERDERVLTLRFGLDNRPPRKLKEIATLLGTQIGNVSNYVRTALANLKREYQQLTLNAS